MNGSRTGCPKRRMLEFRVVVDQVKRRKEEFIARLQRNLTAQGECLLYGGTLDHKGYARLNFRYRGRHVTIHAHRLFLILRQCAPLPKGFEAGHTKGCVSRTCVRHVELQHYRVNAHTNNGETKDNQIPF